MTIKTRKDKSRIVWSNEIICGRNVVGGDVTTKSIYISDAAVYNTTYVDTKQWWWC